MFKVQNINNKKIYNVVSVIVEKIASQQPRTIFIFLDNGELISAPSDSFEPIRPSPFIINNKTFKNGYYIYSTTRCNWILTYCFSNTMKKCTWTWIRENKFRLEARILN